MTGDIHPLGPRSLPSFVGAVVGSDPLFSKIIFIVILQLHAMTEQMLVTVCR